MYTLYCVKILDHKINKSTRVILCKTTLLKVDKVSSPSAPKRKLEHNIKSKIKSKETRLNSSTDLSLRVVHLIIYL